MQPTESFWQISDTQCLIDIIYSDAGAEARTVYCVQADGLQAHVMQHLRSIMGISWRDKISNDEVLKRTGLPSLKAILIQMNLRWLGHVEMMDHERLPQHLLYSQLKEGKRN